MGLGSLPGEAVPGSMGPLQLGWRGIAFTWCTSSLHMDYEWGEQKVRVRNSLASEQWIKGLGGDGGKSTEEQTAPWGGSRENWAPHQ